ncbi:MAG: hypothetical protein Q8L72_09005 [Moraxellaceae bacterium]|nr:hypothetical protein [Moraxellaceae bacterium]
MNRSRWIMLAFLATFIIPFLFGHLAYKSSWFEGAATNKGDLLDPPHALSDLLWQPLPGSTPAPAGHWWLTYYLPATCDLACEQGLDALVRLRIGMGRDRERVGILLLQEQAGDVPAVAAKVPVLARGVVDAAAMKQFKQQFATAEANHWLLMDPMGWIMLSYEVPSAPDALLLRAQDLIDDLMKLLKVSQIG